MNTRLVPLLLFAICVLTSSMSLGNTGSDDPERVSTLGWPTPAVVPAGTVGTLPGTGRVGSDGQYHYTLSLEVPPGRAGMQPELSLEYSSSGSNGFLGVGWRLGGVSAIRQCSKSFAVDGRAKPVSPGLLQRMCLDGVPLIRIADDDAHPNPTDGAEFRTEEEHFARIVFHGGLQEAHYYEVWAKDGRILKYGAIDAPYGVFPLIQVRDRNGNTISYEYDYYNTWIYPTKIRYTGHYNIYDDTVQGPLLGIVPDRGMRTVVINYEDRNDHVLDRQGDETVGITKRIQSIEMHAPVPVTSRTYLGPSSELTEALVWTYTLKYYSSPGTAKSILRSVSRTGAQGGSEYAKVFHWASTGPLAQGISFTPTGATLDVSSLQAFHPLSMDVDGDGRDELLVELGPGNIRLISSASGILDTTTQLHGLANATLTDARFGDVDGDGIPEVIAPDRATDEAGFKYYRLYRWQSGARDYVDPDPAHPLEVYVDGDDVYPQENPLYLADLDGDGLPDIVKADHYIDDPFVDPRRLQVNQPAGLVFDWGTRTNVGGAFAPKQVFFKASPAKKKVNVLKTPVSASPFGAFGLNDGSGAVQLVVSTSGRPSSRTIGPRSIRVASTSQTEMRGLQRPGSPFRRLRSSSSPTPARWTSPLMYTSRGRSSKAGPATAWRSCRVTRSPAPRAGSARSATSTASLLGRATASIRCRTFRGQIPSRRIGAFDLPISTPTAGTT